MLKAEAAMEWETSECSSGCDSGWTMYLGAGQSCEEAATPRGGGRETQEDDEDSLSMASDASSGPPHAHETSYDPYCNDTIGCSYSASSPPFTTSAARRSEAGKRRRAEKAKLLRQQEEASAYENLDDTASSPFFDFSKKSFDLANGTDICSRSSSSNRESGEEASEFSCGFSETHLKDQARGGKKMRIASSLLF